MLPSDKDTRAVAEAAAAEARDEGLRVAVIPTKSVVQSLAAAAVHEPGRRFDDDVVAISARGRCHALRRGHRRDQAGLHLRRGVRGGRRARPHRRRDIVEIGDDLADVAARVLHRLLSGGGELVTLVRGLEADDALVEAVGAALRRDHPAAEVVVYEGGQPLWPLIVGVE